MDVLYLEKYAKEVILAVIENKHSIIIVHAFLVLHKNAQKLRILQCNRVKVAQSYRFKAKAVYKKLVRCAIKYCI